MDQLAGDYPVGGFSLADDAAAASASGSRAYSPAFGASGTERAADGFASAAHALDAVRAGLDYLATADPAELTGAEQADCLRRLAAAESVQQAVAAKVLGAFDAAGAYAADGQAGARRGCGGRPALPARPPARRWDGCAGSQRIRQ
jgi:hypothetical protein